MGSNEFFVTVLSARNQVQLHLAFECFRASRLRPGQAFVVRSRVERVFTRLQIPVPARTS